MKAVDLFCGAGGASRGLHDAGYDVTGYDHWPPAVACHNANGLPAHVHDLSDPEQDHLIPYAPLWWASPPCQPFSAAGAGDGEFDGRDGFPWLLRLVELRRPDVLIVENVKGLTFRKHSGYFCTVVEGLRSLGYVLDWRVLMAADYGVPQTRERCIIIARRDGGPITWPAPTHCETGGMFTLPWVTMADALGWNDTEGMSYHRGAGMNERHGERAPVPATKPAPAVIINSAKDARRVTLHYRQNDPEGNPITCDLTGRPSPTIGTQSQHQWIIEPHGKVPIAELATLQGFPAGWTWTGTKTQQARMVGNAVPPALAHAVVAVNRPQVMERAA